MITFCTFTYTVCMDLQGYYVQKWMESIQVEVLNVLDRRFIQVREVPIAHFTVTIFVGYMCADCSMKLIKA